MAFRNTRGVSPDLTLTQIKKLISKDTGSLASPGSIPVDAIGAGTGTEGDVLGLVDGKAKWTTGGGGVSDHGSLTGLADDDHTQYHNDARGDARYWRLSTDLATQAELDTHTGDATDAHAGTAITNTPAGNIAATTVEAA